ncbi:hypothetical protein [Kitasatospora sp. NPDC089509]|uniref:hypothetical protein n=1 Tax=Kitasatospora sp. NPDC089509 TaxID=3364079 RepID=UPI0037F855AE
MIDAVMTAAAPNPLGARWTARRQPSGAGSGLRRGIQQVGDGEGGVLGDQALAQH